MAERYARGRGIDQLASELAASGRAIDTRLAALPDTPNHRAALAYWVGIERWGQRRLPVAPGVPFLDDVHHPYKPDEAEGIETLRQVFATVRADTIDLVHDLSGAGVATSTTVQEQRRQEPP